MFAQRIKIPVCTDLNKNLFKTVEILFYNFVVHVPWNKLKTQWNLHFRPKTKGSCIFMLFRYLCSICLVSWCSGKCLLIFSKVTEVAVGIGKTQFYKWGKHTLPRLLGLLQGNNRYLLYFYKFIGRSPFEIYHGLLIKHRHVKRAWAIFNASV